MPGRRPQISLAEIILIVLLVGLVLGYVRWLPRSIDDDPLLAFLLFTVGWLGWQFAWGAARKERFSQPCEACGMPFVPAGKGETRTTCNRCRLRSKPPDTARRDTRRTLVALVVLVTIIAGAVLSPAVAARAGPYFWIALPLAAILATAGLILVLFAASYVVFLLRSRRLRATDEYLFARARKHSGHAGEIVESGPLVVWSDVQVDAPAMFNARFEESRRAFEAFVGVPVVETRPIRILSFGQHAAFGALLRDMLMDTWNLDGLYLISPHRAIATSREIIPYRVQEPGRTVRTLLAYALLEDLRSIAPPPWLQSGVAAAVANHEEPAAQDRLVRRMKVALAGGAALDADLFLASSAAITKLMQAWDDHRSFVNYAQFTAQSWSVVEYLGGAGADEDRRARFRSFLTDGDAKASQAELCRRHFGIDPTEILGGWRRWIEAQEDGEPGEPPPDVRAALLDRVIPIVLDPAARPMDRILAIRSMGQAGYRLGADALIGLLRAGDPTLKDEVVWSLEAISGRPFGDDAGRWSAWWDDGETAA